MRVLFVAVLLLSIGAQNTDPWALQRMAATERAFAAATAELGLRDGFLTFLADDAVQIVPGPSGAATTVVPAKPDLAARPLPKLPLTTQLLWEPFTGRISNDGTLGWLTGGYANLLLPLKSLGGQGAYFSVWVCTADGTWRVWLDEGISMPRVWPDGSPFLAAPAPDTGSAGEAGEPLDAAERAVASGGVPWQSRLTEKVRLHRDGQMPVVGREAVVAWARAAWTTTRFTAVTSRVAGSNDLGVVVGGYDATTASGREHGTWVRVWERDVTGRWRIEFETSKKR